tara:strand:+ start:37 stop:240 length:204 start_codon:yes stop_codon:yes gene_type:complete
MTCKIVLMPIEVPTGKFCYDGNVTCEKFDSAGFGTGCGLGLSRGRQEEDRKGRKLKPQRCIELQVQL